MVFLHAVFSMAWYEGQFGILSKASDLVMYQTRETVFHRDTQTPRRELKIRRGAECF